MTNKTKQKNSTTFFWQIEPKIDFLSLFDIYENSFVAWWIVDKIATSSSVSINCEDKDKLKIINSIDIVKLVKNLTITWNAFFEIIRSWDWEVKKVLPISSHTIKKKNWFWYIQSFMWESVEFNEFTDIEERKNIKDFNPKLNEVYHFKLNSLKSPFYWESMFNWVIEQLILINFIDKYYNKFFENSTIKPNLFLDKTWSLWQKDKEIIWEFFRGKMKWVEKAFSTAVITWDLEKIDLFDNLDTNAFLLYRKDLIKSVAIRLNVPIDLIIPEGSNRATANVSKEIFFTHTIKPLQKVIIKGLKEIFWEINISFNEIETKDKREEADIYDIYLRNWVMSIKEVREKLWLES